MSFLNTRELSTLPVSSRTLSTRVYGYKIFPSGSFKLAFFAIINNSFHYEISFQVPFIFTKPCSTDFQAPFILTRPSEATFQLPLILTGAEKVGETSITVMRAYPFPVWPVSLAPVGDGNDVAPVAVCASER